jgi:hypothetical protein
MLIPKGFWLLQKKQDEINLNTSVVRAETLRFKEEGVRDILKDVFLPWYMISVNKFEL